MQETVNDRELEITMINQLLKGESHGWAVRQSFTTNLRYTLVKNSINLTIVSLAVSTPGSGVWIDFVLNMGLCEKHKRFLFFFWISSRSVVQQQKI